MQNTIASVTSGVPILKQFIHKNGVDDVKDVEVNCIN